MPGNCITCQKKLRSDSSHNPHCARCWVKFTEEGKAWNSAKTKKFYIHRSKGLKPHCLACNKALRKDSAKNRGYCRICWEEWTEEGRAYRLEKVRRSQAKKKL